MHDTVPFYENIFDYRRSIPRSALIRPESCQVTFTGFSRLRRDSRFDAPDGLENGDKIRNIAA